MFIRNLEKFLIILFILISINVFIYLHYSLSRYMRQRFSQTPIYSGIAVNSFNPSSVYLTFNKIAGTSILSIMDNNVIILQLSNPSDMSTTTIVLSDGFHHLEFLLVGPNTSTELFQTVDIASGTQSLQVTTQDEEGKPMENIAVHLALVHYAHITLTHFTNNRGEVTFHHLPKQTQISIEALCIKSRLYAYIETSTQNSSNINLILTDDTNRLLLGD